MKIPATESLIIRVADYNPAKLWEQFNFILGRVQYS